MSQEDAKAVSAVPPDNIALPISAGLEQLRGKRFLITGADGMLGRAFHSQLAALVPRSTIFAASRKDLDVCDRNSVMALDRHPADFILHCAAEVDADRCERDPEICRKTQVSGTSNIIQLAKSTGAKVYYPQSVFIFAGSELPIQETTEPNPQFAYGRYKWEAEQLVRQSLPDSLIVRMAGFFGGEERDKNFVGKFSRHLIELARQGQPECGVGDRIWQPTYTMDLARNALYLLACEKSGVYNMACHGEARFFEVASVIAEAMELSSIVTLYRRPAAEVASGELARRPHRLFMENGRLQMDGLDFQRPWKESLREYLALPYFGELRLQSLGSKERRYAL